ncbi:Helix-loop-helix domain containing protein 2-like protein [Dinothrombium tinctorium]|uniref:Helix-loop-helix domain containing protein 2-like protein n=1 Tax=Dinothrombium tinctorium TaxID=1965070 RepID=A0A443RQF9_9ACAR|nr:Helix-loop-helix domain containing protein 2-like protein [Dinothrombium tinctorium]
MENCCDDGTAVAATCEDIWNKFDDFLLTPPQSPPIKFELVSDTLDDDYALSCSADSLTAVSVSSECANGSGSLYTSADVLHDCMWSGLCNEDFFSPKHNGCAKVCGRQRCDSLSASPFSLIACSFTDLYNTCNDVDSEGQIDDDTQQQQDEDEQYEDLAARTTFAESTVFVSSESLKNDHSYGSPDSSPKQSAQSLIVPKNKVKTATREAKAAAVKAVRNNDELNAPQITVKFVKRQSCVAKSVIGSADSSSASRRCRLSQSKRTTTTSVPTKFQNKRNIEQVATKSEHETSLLAKSASKSSKSMYPEKRREHNDSERKRRDHLRNAFHFLRDQIPKLKDTQKKPARIVILSEATSFVNSLKEKHLYLEKTKEAELTKREKLLKRLTLLKQSHY